MYALNINTETNRILSATFEQYASVSMPLVESLPEGNISDYLYVNNNYVYDPIPPEPVVPDEIQILEARLGVLQDQNDMLMECIMEMSEIVYQ